MKKIKWLILALFLFICIPFVFAEEAPSLTDDLSKLADSIAVEIAKLRAIDGEEIKVKKSIKSKAEIKRYIINKVNEEYSQQDLVNEGKVLIKLGLVPSYINYPEMVIQILTSAIGGYYEPEEKTLFIADWVPKEKQEFILAHEIAHYLQDRIVDLNSFLKVEKNDDQQIAHRSVIEGEAVALAMDYLLRDKNIEFTAVTSNAGMFIDLIYGQSTLNPDTSFIYTTINFPYLYGLKFLRELRLKYPWTYMNEIYKNPPTSTEQIIHPEKYLKEKDNPISIELPEIISLLGDSWKKIYENTLGEYVYKSILESFTNPVTADLGSNGWGGDRIVSYENLDSKKELLIYISTWDSFQDAKEFLWAYNEAIKNKYLEEKMRDAIEKNSLIWDTEDGIAFIEIRDKNVLVIEGAPNLQLCQKVNQSIWQDIERQGLLTTKETLDLKEIKLTAHDFYQKGKDFLEAFINTDITPYFLTYAKFYLEKAIELDEGFQDAYPLLARVTVAINMNADGTFDEQGSKIAFYYIDKAEKINPDFPRLHWAKAHAYRALKRYETAIEEINKAISKEPNNPEYFISLGKIYYEQKDYLKALEAVNKALSFKPIRAQEAIIYNYQGNAYWKLSKFEEGIKCFQDFLKLEPNSPIVLDMIAYLLSESGKYEEAIVVQKEALRYEESEIGHTRLGWIYERKGMYEEAEKEYLHVNNKKYLQGLVEEYRLKGWFEKADNLLKKMAGKKEEAPLMLQDIEIYVNKGILNHEQGKLDEAIDNYKKVLEIEPSYAPAYIYLADIYETKLDTKGSSEFYKKAETLDKKKAAKAYYNLGDIYTHKKRDDVKAMRFLKKAIELDPEHAEAHYSLGSAYSVYAYSHGKDYTSSVTMLRKALELGLKTPAVYYALGAAYYEWGKYNEAIFYFMQCLKLEPENSHAKHYLEESKKKLK